MVVEPHVNSKLWEHDQMNDIPDKRDHVRFCPSVNLSDELLCWEGSLTSSPLLFHLSCCCTPLSTSCSSIQHWSQLSPPCTPEKFCKSRISISSSKPKKPKSQQEEQKIQYLLHQSSLKHKTCESRQWSCLQSSSYKTTHWQSKKLLKQSIKYSDDKDTHGATKAKP